MSSARLMGLLLALCSMPVLANDGQELYEEYCQSCHQPDAAGLEEFEGSLQDFAGILEGETEDMPDFYGFFNEEEVAALYKYIND